MNYTPKDKALKLYEIFDNYPLTIEWKKQFAIKVVDEIIDSLKGTDMVATYGNYWDLVKEHLNNIEKKPFYPFF